MDNKVLGMEINKARQKKRISRKELAKKMGYCVATISHWENGIREPKGTDLIRLIEIIEVDIGTKSKKDKKETQCSI